MPAPRNLLSLTLVVVGLGTVAALITFGSPAVRGADACVTSGYLGGLNTPTCPLGAAAGGTQTATMVPAVPPQDCGLVQMRGPETVNRSAARQAEDCLWQAYQQCVRSGKALLRVTEMGVDTFRTRDFTVQDAGSGCAIEESDTFRVVPRSPMTATYRCAGLTRAVDNALHFLACGNDGDIIVPYPKA